MQYFNVTFPDSAFWQSQGIRPPALIRNKLSFRKNMVEYIGCEFDESFSNTIKYFKDKELSEYPTAILCFNDYQALAVISSFKKTKNDCSTGGFSNWL